VDDDAGPTIRHAAMKPPPTQHIDSTVGSVIARQWRGRVPADLAQAYLALMRERAIPDYRSVEGNIAAFCLSREEAGIVHVVMVSWWRDLASIARFTDGDITTARYYDFDRDYLLELTPTVEHFAMQGAVAELPGYGVPRDAAQGRSYRMAATSAPAPAAVATNHNGGRMSRNPVLAVKPAPSDVALAHFSQELVFEADCADVHEAMQGDDPGFVLVDARGPAQYAAGHVPGAINIPHGKIIQSKMAAFPAETVFVVYCDGPHCNGATRAAMRLASLGRPVKKMVGGVHGWLLDGYELVKDEVGSQA
jgi:rhodanese-related sulfurtransferase